MTPIGFSTGTLALGDFRLGLQMLDGKPAAAVELSALRDVELERLVHSLDDLNLSQFSYVSVHAPSQFIHVSERQVLDLLAVVFERQWPVVVHPDAITDWERWRDAGEWVCIENMDKRKPIGRTADELATIFDRLPDATLCFDVGHARQIDPTMLEARMILRRHGRRLRQLHVSDVNSASGHEPLNLPAIWAFERIAHLIPQDIPIIMETPVPAELLGSQMEQALSALRRR